MESWALQGKCCDTGASGGAALRGQPGEAVPYMIGLRSFHKKWPGLEAAAGHSVDVRSLPHFSCFSSSGGFLLFLGGLGWLAGFAFGGFAGCDSACGRAFSG